MSSKLRTTASPEAPDVLARVARPRSRRSARVSAAGDGSVAGLAGAVPENASLATATAFSADGEPAIGAELDQHLDDLLARHALREGAGQMQAKRGCAVAHGGEHGDDRQQLRARIQPVARQGLAEGEPDREPRQVRRGSGEAVEIGLHVAAGQRSRVAPPARCRPLPSSAAGSTGAQASFRSANSSRSTPTALMVGGKPSIGDGDEQQLHQRPRLAAGVEEARHVELQLRLGAAVGEQHRHRAQLPQRQLETRSRQHVAIGILDGEPREVRRDLGEAVDRAVEVLAADPAQQLEAALVAVLRRLSGHGFASVGDGCDGSGGTAEGGREEAAAIVCRHECPPCFGGVATGAGAVQAALAVGRTMISLTSTSAGCSMAKAMARAMASGGIATLAELASSPPACRVGDGVGELGLGDAGRDRGDADPVGLPGAAPSEIAQTAYLVAQ